MYGAKGVHGYGWYVQQNQSSDVIVELPRDNCQDARYLLSYFDELVTTKEDVFDVVHWNNGLWDVLHFAGNPVPYTSLEQYIEAICSIKIMLSKIYPTAQICFALTTSASEHLQNSSSYRKNEEIAAYNEAAIKALTKMNVDIDDLNIVARNIGNEYRLKDGIHFTEMGAELLSDAVFSFIKERCDRT